MKNKSPVVIQPIQQFQFDLIGKDVADNKTTETVSLKDCTPPAYPTISMPDNLNCEDARLRTFNNWPHSHISPQKLAITGFYFVGSNNDNVKCYFCKVEIGCWEQDDDEVNEHVKWSPNCPLLRRRDTNNVPIDAAALDRLLPPPTYDVCGPCGAVDVRHGSFAESSFTIPPAAVETPMLKHPVHADYAIESVRIRSFEGWPKSIKQKPKDLSDAGFFSIQKGDKVKCFSCGGGLSDWEENDDPWEQHALWFSKCEYLKLMKGQEYIDSILERKKLQDESESSASDDEEIRSADAHAKVAVRNSNTNSLQSPPSSSSSSSSGSDAECSSGSDEGPSEKKLCESRLCKICYTCEYNTVFLKCGHAVACAKCASSVTKCPVCRQPFESILRVYFS